MKIVYCIDSLISSGGTERVTTTKLNWLVKQADVELWVVTLREKKVPFFDLDAKVRRVMLDANNASSYRKELESLFADIRPNVAVAVAGYSRVVLPSLKDSSKKIMEFHYTKNYLVNFVNGMRNDPLKKLRLIKMRWLQYKEERKAKQFDCLVGLTKRDVGLWGNPKNMTYIYNPLSFRSEKKSTCENKRIIAVGSLTPAKGMDQLVEAFGRIAKSHKDWCLDIYGSGQDEAFLNILINKYQISEQVSIHKPCPNICEKLIESSIYAFPSRSDGFGLVITEAMECGLPTVAMDCECGPREIVTGNTGVVVPDKNIDAFAEALARLMDDDILRKQMGKSAQVEVNRFYPNYIMPQWLNLFTKLYKS